MAELDNVLIFVKVAQYESITRAARSLGMPISTVSRRLSALESELGVSLLRRTTRRVTLTPQGRDYFNQCQEPLALLQEAEQALTRAQITPQGLLRVTVANILGQGPFLDFVSGFLKAHPRIQIDLVITNQFLDLLGENIDLAIRYGELQDSAVVARRLGGSVRHLTASPRYLAARAQPGEPGDLRSHDCVMLNARNNESVWDLISGRKRARVAVTGPISSRTIDSVSGFVHRGHGIGLLPASYCEASIAAGRLVHLLPEWTSVEIPVFAVYPGRKFLPARLRAFLEALAAWESPFWTR